ncbi:MAG: Hsp20/alpha crystallin family protein [Acidobacteria bacterium]|nr:Hsp20/alpha crystallin family protein [Acidobacteriota bacterium]
MTTTLKTQEKQPEMRPARWSPSNLWQEMENDLERLWDARFMTRMPRLSSLWTKGEDIDWLPRMDVSQKGRKMTVKVDLPGMVKEDVKVALDNGDLMIEGERKLETVEEEEQYYRCERSHGKFMRRIPLPFDGEPEEIKAKFKDGVLKVELKVPKEVVHETKTIEIN